MATYESDLDSGGRGHAGRLPQSSGRRDRRRPRSGRYHDRPDAGRYRYESRYHDGPDHADDPGHQLDADRYHHGPDDADHAGHQLDAHRYHERAADVADSTDYSGYDLGSANSAEHP
jgi:hypothetical protein